MGRCPPHEAADNFLLAEVPAVVGEHPLVHPDAEHLAVNEGSVAIQDDQVHAVIHRYYSFPKVNHPSRIELAVPSGPVKNIWRSVC